MNSFTDIKKTLKYSFCNAIQNKEYLAVEKYINMYYKLYESFIDQIKKFNLEENINKYTETNWYSKPFETISGIEHDIFEGFKQAVDVKDKEIEDDIILLVYRILSMGAMESAKFPFEQFFYVYVRFYYYIVENNIIGKSIKEKLIDYYFKIINLYLDYKIRDEKVAISESILFFYDKIFSSVNDIINLTIKYKDTESFINITKKLNKDRHVLSGRRMYLQNKIRSFENDNKNIQNLEIGTLKKELEIIHDISFLKIFTLIGIQSWLWFNYLHTLLGTSAEEFDIIKITEEELIEYQKHINIPHLSDDDFTIIIKKFVDRQTNIFNWESWGNETKRNSREVYTPITADSWLFNGLIYEIVRKDYLLSDKLEEKLLESESSKYLYEQVKLVCDNLMKIPEDWTIIFNIHPSKELSSTEQLNNRIQNVLQFFEKIKVKREMIETANYAKQKVEENLIKDFKNKVYEAWQESNVMFELFKYFNSVEYTTEKVEGWGVAQTGLQYKMMFVKDNYQEIWGMEQFGREVSRTEKNFFWMEVKSGKNIIEAEYVVDAFKDIFKERKQKGLKTDLIISLLGTLIYNRELTQEGKLIPNWQMKDTEKKFKGIEGIYEDIPIIELYLGYEENFIMFCDFTESFKMIVQKNENWQHEILDIIVKELSEYNINSEIERIKKENYKEDWMKYSNGQPMSDQDLTTELKTAMYIGVFEHFKFVVKNKNAYDIVKINNIYK